MLVNGKWNQSWQPVQASDGQGGFLRQRSFFRHTISRDRHNPYQPEAGRYHLYVALICPWANRTLIARKLKGLEGLISVSVVEPFLGDQGWRFGDYPGSDRDEITRADYLHEIYTRAAPRFSGRATVPVLWDKQTGTIVNNESADILRLFNSAFGELANGEVDLYPAPLRSEIDEVNQRLYDHLNNGVYRAGFATTQGAYEKAVNEVFDSLAWLDARLKGRRYLVGDRLTEADIRTFVTLIRFEPVYYGLFKCNKRHLWEYENVWTYLCSLYAVGAFRSSVNFDHIKRGYYSIKALNPNGIVPVGSGREQP